MLLRAFCIRLIAFATAVAAVSYKVVTVEPCVELASVELKNACKFGGLQLTSAGGTLIYESNCNVLVPKQVFRDRPRVLYGYANRTKLYTVIALDPDAPKLNPGQFYLHWLRTNVPGTSLADNEDVDGLDIAPYTGPAPPNNTGIHQYMFFVYEQRNGHLPPRDVMRKPFDMDIFRANKKLCGPLAGVQFRSIF